jgi:hypothetical protein
VKVKTVKVKTGLAKNNARTRRRFRIDFLAL